MMMAKLQISQETIKPSSPTPKHLKTHNLSLLDQFAPDMHMPIVFFYPNYKNGDTKILKKSLSRCLTHYYPFAARIINQTPPAPYVNCNDQGVEFLEAFNDSLLDDFIHKNHQHEIIDQLFPYGLSSITRVSCPKLLEVQLNHFAGGGAAVAVSISHKLADGATIANLINHWAILTRGGLPINPCFISSPTSNYKTVAPKFIIKDDKDCTVKYATRRFVFRNTKLNELKNKVIASGTAPMNPTRVEVLTSLLYIRAARTKSGTLEPSNLCVTVNLRKKFVEKYPETAAGNIFTLAIGKMAADSGEMRLSEVVGEIRKGKMEVEGVRDEGEVVEKLANAFLNLEGGVYYSTSLCRIPFYEVDFGWGKPVEVRIRIPKVEENTLILMDTPSGDGTALVHLPQKVHNKEEMSNKNTLL